MIMPLRSDGIPSRCPASSTTTSLPAPKDELFGHNTIGQLERHGKNALTSAAEIALHIVAGAPTTQAVDQVGEIEQIANTQRTAPARHRDEHIDVAGVRPAPRQRALRPVLVEEEHTILAPRLAHSDEHELAPHPRMERMRHPNSSLLTIPLRRS